MSVLSSYDHNILLDNSEDVVLIALGRQHLKSSFFSLWDISTKCYIDMFDCEARPWVPSLFEQKNVIEKMRNSRSRYCFKGLIVKRLKRFVVSDDFDWRADRIISIYRCKSASIGPRFVMNHLKTITNHWCSSSRFGKLRKPCWFCGKMDSESNDRMVHSFVCPTFRSVFCKIHSNCTDRFTLMSVFCFRYQGIALDNRGIDLILYYTLLVFRAYNSCRRGTRFSERSLTSICKQVVTQSAAAWKIRRGIVLYSRRS